MLMLVLVPFCNNLVLDWHHYRPNKIHVSLMVSALHAPKELVPMVTRACKVTWKLTVNLLVYHSPDRTVTHIFLVAFNSFLATWMLLDRGTAKHMVELVSALQSMLKDPETAPATKPKCSLINLVWPNAQLSCRWQYPLTQKPIWHLWDHTRVGGYRCVGTDCEPFQQVYQHKSMATCPWSQSSQCFCGSRSLTFKLGDVNTLFSAILPDTRCFTVID